MIGQRLHDLGDFYLACSTHLFQNFSKLGIEHWWENKRDTPKGAAVFLSYDPVMTCLRQMPNSPRLFQASLRSNILSHDEATSLGHELLETLRVLRRKYSGFFDAELGAGPIGRSEMFGAQLPDFALSEAHTSLATDDVAATLPWPCIPSVHFAQSSHVTAGIRADYFDEAAKSPLRAMSLATDVVMLGPSLDLDSTKILEVLKWLRSPETERRVNGLRALESKNVKKIFAPSFAAGFQGLAYGTFVNLPPELEAPVASQLQQFSSTVGEELAYIRYQNYLVKKDDVRTIENISNLIINLLPPVDSLVVSWKGGRIGYRLSRECSYLAGYKRVNREEDVRELLAPSKGQPSFEIVVSDITVTVTLCSDSSDLSALFTMLRLKRRLATLSLSSERSSSAPLTRAELGVWYHSLRRQIRDGKGVIAASKKLLVIECALKDFERGESTLTNSRAKEYLSKMLGSRVVGYHIAGKATEKLKIDVQKLAGDRFSFEPLSSYSVKVRWRPSIEEETDLQSIELVTS